MGGHRVFRRTACAVAVAAIFTPSSALPAAVNWTDGTGFWDAAANWSSNPLLPGAGDDVTVNVAGLNTITYRTGTTTVDSLTFSGTNTLAVTAGTLAVANAYSNSSLTNISGGTLTLNGASTADSLTLSSGVFRGTGTVSISGATTWSGGTMTGAGTTQANGGIAISGDTAHDLTGGRVLNVAGNSTWSGNTFASGGSIRTGAGAQINNAGVWQDQNAFDSSISNAFGGAAGTFNNTGTYTKSGAGTTDIGIAFNNTSGGAGTGVVNVTAGTLQLSGGGTSNGTFTIAGGATQGLDRLDAGRLGQHPAQLPALIKLTPHLPQEVQRHRHQQPLGEILADETRIIQRRFQDVRQHTAQGEITAVFKMMDQLAQCPTGLEGRDGEVEGHPPPIAV
jgi:hypothetical protein